MIKPEKNYSLSKQNTLAVESQAEYFYAFTNVQELAEAVGWAKSRKHGVSVLGGGSNALLTQVVPGLVLHPAIMGKQLIKQDDTNIWLRVGAGENWHAFTQWCIQNNYFGLENLSLIPGNVGASPIQNIGAYGVEVASIIACVEVFNVMTGELTTLEKDACQFNYRDSVFKHEAGRHLVVTHVCFCLSKNAQTQLKYPALVQYLESNGVEKPTPKQVAEAVINIRSEKLPEPETVPNAGSFFKNPIVTEARLHALLKSYPQLPHFKHDTGTYKLPAAWLIDQAGWKGKDLGGVSVHQNQALVLINPNRKPLAAILTFAEAIQADINNMFQVRLEIEPQQLHQLQLHQLQL